MVRTGNLLLLALMAFSCFQQKAIERQSENPTPVKTTQSRTGLNIETSPTRGTALTDSLGSKYFIAHVTNTITNDSTVPIQIHIDFPVNFKYPIAGQDVHYMIILWPEVTEPPGLYIDRQVQVQFMPNWTISDWEKPNQFDKLLAPGESYVITIGTLVEMQDPNVNSAVAFSLLPDIERSNYADCDWPLDQKQFSDSQRALGLQIGFYTSGRHYEHCTIRTCGQFAYL